MIHVVSAEDGYVRQRDLRCPSEAQLRSGCCAGLTSGLNIPENKVGGKGAKALAEAIGSGVTKLGGLVFSSAHQSHTDLLKRPS